MKRSITASEAASRRWKLLKKAIVLKQTDPTDSISMLRFTSFNIVQREHLDDWSTEGDWYRYQCPEYPISVNIRHCAAGKPDLNSFNNTGNVCVWPSEELLAYHCLKNREEFTGLCVCELGGGMSCLAGLMLARAADVSQILLTDGNEKAVQNVSATLAEGKNEFKCKDVSARLLRWDEEYPDLAAKFDVIICADCVFFDEHRSALVATMDRLLTPLGSVVLLAPARGQTLQRFLVLASERFATQQLMQHDKTVHEKHKALSRHGPDVYDPNLHRPLMVRLYRKQRPTGNS